MPLAFPLLTLLLSLTTQAPNPSQSANPRPDPHPDSVQATGLGTRGAKTQEPQTQANDNHQKAHEVLRLAIKRVAGDRPDAIKGVVLSWQEYELGKPSKEKGKQPTRILRCKVEASIAFPDRLRLEIKDPKGLEATTIYLRTRKQAWIGTAGGPFVNLGGKARAQLDDTFKLLGTLLFWDGLDAKASDGAFEAGVLTTKATWLPGAAPFTIARRYGPNSADGKIGRLEGLTLGKRRLSLSGEIRGTGGRVPRTIRELRVRKDGTGASNSAKAKNPQIIREITRFGTSYTFTQSRFSAEHKGGQKREIRQERETRNFRAPILERIQAARELVVKDPGTWPKRFSTLQKLGMALYRLKQSPAGLPIYTTAGEMLIPYLPDPARKGATDATPQGHKARARATEIAAVVYVKGTWATAKKTLGVKLLSFLTDHGKRPKSPLRMIPYALPGSKCPEESTELVFRGEILIR